MEYYNKSYASDGLIPAIMILYKKGTTTYQDIFRAMLQRCNISFFSTMDANLLLMKENIDHFMVKDLLENNNFAPQYLEIIKKDLQLAKFPGQLTLHNHFLNVLPNEKLKEVLPDDIYQEVVTLKENQAKKKSEIMDKINANEMLTQKELDYICDCFAFNRDKNDQEHRKLIEYIFENLPKKDCKLYANTLVSDAILSFIPKIFKTKDNDDFSDVRIINHSASSTFLGYTDSTNVYIDRNFYSLISFKKFTDVDNLSNNSSSGLISYLQTVFHELVHIDQYKNSQKTKFNDSGYMKIASKIFRTYLSDYNLNHDNYEIEVDADQKAWLHIKDFFQEFIKDEDLKRQLIPKFNANSIGNHFRRSTLQKVDNETNETKETDLFDVETLNKIVRKNPSLIKTYPMLKTFYNEQGELKLDYLTKPEISKSIIGTNYTKYVILTKTNELKEKLKYNTNKKSFSNMVGSIYSAAMNEAQREKASTFTQERNIKSDREDHINEETPNQIKKRTTQIITNALNILNNPYTINRKTTFFSPITYINRLADKLSHNDLEPAIARSR